MDSSRFPIDFDGVNKGDKFTPEDLEKCLGVSQSAANFPLVVLSFVDRLRNELESRGKPCTVAVIKKCVCVLTDQEAAVYNAEQFNLGLRKSGRAHQRNIAVNVANLAEDQRQQHERTLTTQAAILTGIRTARKTAIASHKRTTPGIESK